MKYTNTPHRTIEQILQDARDRVKAGEDSGAVSKDLIEGYGFSYGSRNAEDIHKAIKPEVPLIFEGAGWEKSSSSSDVSNCRIRTRIRNNAGTVIYLEINGMERTKYTPRKFPVSGYVMHCYSADCNESSIWRNLERNSEFNYTAEGVLQWVNENLACSFDALRVVNDGSVQVHDTEQPLCESTEQKEQVTA